MNKSGGKYQEIARGRINEKRCIVVSERNDGGITVAQQLESHEGDHVTSVFLKGAFHVDGINGLQEIRDVMNVAIKVLSEEDLKEASEDHWEDELAESWDDGQPG